jgi:hypothetical protein
LSVRSEITLYGLVFALRSTRGRMKHEDEPQTGAGRRRAAKEETISLLRTGVSEAI